MQDEESRNEYDDFIRQGREKYPGPPSRNATPSRDVLRPLLDGRRGLAIPGTKWGRFELEGEPVGKDRTVVFAGQFTDMVADTLGLQGKSHSAERAWIRHEDSGALLYLTPDQVQNEEMALKFIFGYSDDEFVSVVSAHRAEYDRGVTEQAKPGMGWKRARLAVVFQIFPTAPFTPIAPS